MTTPMKVVPKAGEGDRDAQGYPEGLRNTAEPRSPVNTSTITSDHPITAKVDQSNSGNVNHHLPWLMFISMVATAALMMCILGYIYGPRLIRAELRAEFAQDVADTRAEARAAGTDAAIAKNTVQKLEARINVNERK